MYPLLRLEILSSHTASLNKKQNKKNENTKHIPILSLSAFSIVQKLSLVHLYINIIVESEIARVIRHVLSLYPSHSD